MTSSSPVSLQVQSKAEKKPGTPPPAPAVSHAPSHRSPSPPPAAAVIITPSPPPPPAINIPRFYYPRGLPAAGPPANHDAAIAAIEAAFAEFEEEKADIYEMSKVAKVTDLCDLKKEPNKAFLLSSIAKLREKNCWTAVFPAGVRVSALLEGGHVLRGRRRKNGLRLGSLLCRHLEEVGCVCRRSGLKSDKCLKKKKNTWALLQVAARLPRRRLAVYSPARQTRLSIPGAGGLHSSSAGQLLSSALHFHFIRWHFRQNLIE